MAISDGYREELEELILEYRMSSMDAVRLLEKVVDIFGFLPEEVVRELAECLDLPIEELWAVAKANGCSSSVLNGKHLISICCGTTCFVKSSNELVEQFSFHLGIAPGETTPDGEFSLEIVHCLGACGFGPNVMIDGEVYANMDSTKVARVLQRYRKEAAVK